MSEELIKAEMMLFRATEAVVAVGKALGRTRSQVWEDLMQAAGEEPETLALRRTQFDMCWPEA